MARLTRILVSGSTGMIGRALVTNLRERGVDVRRLVRRRPLSEESDAFEWDPRRGFLDSASLDGVEGVVHLAGEPVLGRRDGTEHRRNVLESRTAGTTLLLRAASASPSVSTVVSASAIGWYGARRGADEPVTEAAPPGPGVLAEICERWEHAATEAFGADPQQRLVLARFGLVLSRQGGALAEMLRVGGLIRRVPVVRDGSQWMSWVSLDDAVRSIVFLLEHGTARGPVNIVSPNPVRQSDMAAAVASASGLGGTVRVPEWVVRLRFGRLGVEALARGVPALPAAMEKLGHRWEDTDLGAFLRTESAGGIGRA